MLNVECRLPDSILPFDNRSAAGGTIDNPKLAAIGRALESVVDPEIPVVNVIEMGMIAGIRMEADCVVIDMTPTFVGCPALDMIRENIRVAVSAVTPAQVRVIVVFDPPWTSERISETGRQKLKAFGLAPPGDRCSGGTMQALERTPCPYCDSKETDLESIFGPTLCRSIHYCRSCLQSFEHFKAV
jgi:ring-1,2-phenylacetyl-CoA epoxidase subunit PaaD